MSSERIWNNTSPIERLQHDRQLVSNTKLTLSECEPAHAQLATALQGGRVNVLLQALRNAVGS
jgi:hypothetical protein